MFIIYLIIELFSILSLWILVFIVSKGVVIAEIRLPAINGGIMFKPQKFIFYLEFLIERYSAPAIEFRRYSKLTQYSPEKVKSLTSDTLSPCMLTIDLALI